MRSIPVENKATGYITVEPVLAEGAEILETIHGLDADNLDDEELVAEKFVVGTFATVARGSRETPQVTTLNGKHRPGDVYGIPEDASTDPWIVDLSCRDGWMTGTFSISVDSDYTSGDGGGGYSFWVGVRLDGELVGIGPAGTALFLRTSSHVVDFALPVAGGDHVIEFVYGYAGTLAPGKEVDLSWDEGSYFIRVVER